ncbi:MAG: hypothetical protein HY574_04615 [candidate division NC10 bacterium]|nr:hypothetical protein [candidate division NC10 bacterium]
MIRSGLWMVALNVAGRLLGMVRQLCQAHLAGHADHSHRLWTLLTFEVWLRTFPQWPRSLAPEGLPAPIALMRSGPAGGRG